MTEDDTFRKLTQRPYDEVKSAIHYNSLREYKGIDTDILLKHYGWTVKEFDKEWEKRNRTPHRG